LAGSDKPHHWEKTASRLHADCKIFDVYKSRFRHPIRQLEGDFFVIDAPDWITVVAVTEKMELVAVRQYRFGIEDLSLEVPAGVMETGEDPLETGIRELREETGFEGDNAEVLGWVYPNPAIQNNRCYVIGVHQARQVSSTDWDEHEEVQTQLIPLTKLDERLARGDFQHALSVCTFHFYRMKYPV
jgi:ADP-ribose pyrophosphatase